MRGGLDGQSSEVVHRVHGTKKDASFQVIILGSGGGPREDTATGLLVRAPQAEWRKSSMIAIDAGVHLASIISILQQYMPYRSNEIAAPGYSKVLEEGPFAGVHFPFISAKANALFIFREMLHSFLITHPHLDHLAAMGINTPALEFGREAKAIVALPPVIEAIKAHIFNDSIWPNLSDEDHGVGFVTYRRLAEGGNQRLGSGDARGYVSVCDGLATKCLSVTHGKCQRRNHSLSHQRRESSSWFSNDYAFPPRRMSRMSDDHSYFAAMAQQQAYNGAPMHNPAQLHMPSVPLTPVLGGGPGSIIAGEKDYLNEPVTSSAFFIRNDATGREILIFGDIEPDSVSISPRNHLVWDEAAPKIADGNLKAIFIECSYDDDVRDQDLFGHLCPRHLIAELDNLARRVMSYRERKNAAQLPRNPDSPTSTHNSVKEPPSQIETTLKRKRTNGDALNAGETQLSPNLRPLESTPNFTSQYMGAKATSQSYRRASRDFMNVGGHSPLQRPLTPSKIPKHVQFQGSPRTHLAMSPQLDFDHFPAPATAPSAAGFTSPSLNPVIATVQPGTTHSEAEADLPEKLPAPLQGLTVHVIHVKDTMVDGPLPGEIILEQLQGHATAINLGCEFDVTDCGESIWI